MSSRLVIALGIAGCIITAGCDLSAGRMIGLGGCIAGTLLQKMDYSQKFFPNMKPMNIFLALLIVMLVCALFGAVTGFFIAYLNVPPFISTHGNDGDRLRYQHDLHQCNSAGRLCILLYRRIASGRFLGISYLIWIALLVAVITWFIFNMTRHGKYMYAIGGNPQAAEVAGVPVKTNSDHHLRKSSCYVWSGRFHAGRKSRRCFRTAWLWL